MSLANLIERVKSRRIGLGVKMYAAFGAGVLLMLAASVAALLSFGVVDRSQRNVTGHSVPSLAAAVRTAQQASALVDAAPRLVAVASDDELHDANLAIFDNRERLNDLLEELRLHRTLRNQDEVRLLRSLSDALGGTLENLKQSLSRRRDLQNRLRAREAEIPVMTRRIDRVLVPAIDNQQFFLATGLRELGDRPVPLEKRASHAELVRYRNLLTLHTQANLAARLLAEASVLNDRTLIQPLRERYNAALGAFGRAFQSTRPDSSAARSLAVEFERLRSLGQGPEGIFGLQEAILRQKETEAGYIEENRATAERLHAAVARVVMMAEDEANEAGEASTAAVNTGMAVLAALNVANVIVVVALGWFFVGRHLVRRLTGLAASMRSMAGGNLEAPVEVSGNDEVTDMAEALEVFRRHALEVQRLNLVEKLADELKDRNAEMERTLRELEAVQRQVIMREKLASLGQLTAGIAHEIKNPLNFVNNFSELSGELVAEVREVLGEVHEKVPGDARDEIDGMLDGLAFNLGKINEHGKRADGIVRSMLDHSRGRSGDRRAVDLNALLKQYADLAYHAMRARDRRFNVTWEEDFDTRIDEVITVPQDWSRVFLNLVNNACQATFERARGDERYRPRIRLSSRRQGDQVEFRIRDNGPGIPRDMIGKIFEPFVTTRPTGEGTGLGLSLSQDIVAQHGGLMGVESEPGVFTEFWVSIPAPAGPSPGAQPA
ncbi:MAG: HAMP domain-containing sensor histidine kinase [Deltaproteobacteria bacterium]|nr:HAMP domain-containing sensor histidine kinase [Deltaproteobacteria bacterium]